MTFHSTGYRIICDFANCGRQQDIPSRDEVEASQLAAKLGWQRNAATAPAQDYCPEHTALLQSQGKLGPRQREGLV